MLGPIIMVLDGSRAAEAVIALAVQFAQRSGVPLHLAEVPDFTNTVQPADGVCTGTPPSLALTGLRLHAVADRCAELGTLTCWLSPPMGGLDLHRARWEAALPMC